LALEKRVRNLDTAEGGGGGSGKRSGDSVEVAAVVVELEPELELATAERTGATIGGVDVVGDATGEDGLLSVLGLGEEIEFLGESGLLSATGGVDALREKNEERMPVFFLDSMGVAGVSSFFSTIRQPAGKTASGRTSGRALTEASHAVEPLVARYYTRVSSEVKA